MATRKKGAKERKLHPKRQGDGGPDEFVPADRPDQVTADASDRPGVIDVLELGEGGGEGLNLDSRTEGDARDLDTEGDGSRGAATGDDDDDDRRPSRRNAREDDEGGGDERDYGRRVRARINRERAITKGLRQELNTERTAREQLEQRLARLERGQTDQSAANDIKALEAQITQTVAELETATEAGETKKVVALQIKLSDLQSDLKLKKFQADQARQRAAEEAQRSSGKDATRTRDDGPGEEDAPDIQEFLEANSHWWGKRRYREEQEHAVSIDRTILREIKEGDADFEAYSPEHFEELGRRLKKHYPKLEVCDVDGEPLDADGDDEGNEGKHVNGRNGNGARNGSRAPMSGMGTRGGRRTDSEVALASQGKVNLTKEDFQEMRVFNLDPNNPEHKKRFARERLRTIKTSGRGVRT